MKRMNRRTRRRLARVSLLAFLAAALVFAKHRITQHRAFVINNNESHAIASLKNLSSAQAQLQASGRVDANGNGAGEFGDLRDLRAFLPNAFGQGTRARVVVQGYVFEAHLPDSADEREKTWAFYAWPERYGTTGKRAFYVNQHGDVVAARNVRRRYSGTELAPRRTAALAAGRVPSQIAVNTTGGDGQFWTII